MTRTLYKDSAFRHGFSRSDYRQVLRNPKVVLRNRRGYQNVYEIFGRSDAGTYVHVLIRRLRRGPSKTEIVFHMCPMTPADRKRYRKMTRK